MSLTLWGHGNCARIPALADYAEAKEHYQKVVPIRGRNPEVKPLGRVRRFTWYEIRENTIANQAEGTEYKTYACNLYGRDLVEFFPNGDVVINTRSWYSITTGAFINFCIGKLGTIVSESGKWYFENKAGQSFRLRETMRIRKGDDGFFVPTEIEEDKVHRVNRKAMNAVRKKYRPLLDYGKTMLGMDNKITRVEDMERTKHGFHANNGTFTPYYSWNAGKVNEDRARWFELANKQQESGDLELLYDLVRIVASGAGRYSYHTSTYHCEPRWFEDKVNEMIKYQFRDEVFVAEALPFGERCADRNKKYFNFK
jgi:hypothetical protein